MLPLATESTVELEKKRSFKNGYLLIITLLVGVIIFLVALSQIDRKKLNEQAFTAKSLAYELKNFEAAMQDMQATLEDKSLELEQKDRLLEEKNIELAYLTTHVKDMESATKSSTEEIKKLKQQLAAAQKTLQESFATLRSERLLAGLIYRVQVGMHESEAFLPEKVGPLEVVEENGIKKYLIGIFQTYEESLILRDVFRSMGIADAWVVPYVNGKRVSAEEAAGYEINTVPKELISEFE